MTQPRVHNNRYPELWAKTHARRGLTWGHLYFSDGSAADGGECLDVRRTPRGAGVRAHLPHAQAGHSHTILRHVVVGLGNREEPPLGLALVFLFIVKTLPALIAAYPEPTHQVLLFQVEVSGAARCHAVAALFPALSGLSFASHSFTSHTLCPSAGEKKDVSSRDCRQFRFPANHFVQS